MATVTTLREMQSSVMREGISHGLDSTVESETGGPVRVNWDANRGVIRIEDAQRKEPAKASTGR